MKSCSSYFNSRRDRTYTSTTSRSKFGFFSAWSVKATPHALARALPDNLVVLVALDGLSHSPNSLDSKWKRKNGWGGGIGGSKTQDQRRFSCYIFIPHYQK